LEEKTSYKIFICQEVQQNFEESQNEQKMEPHVENKKMGPHVEKVLSMFFQMIFKYHTS
jgi:hypothetical protein